MAAAPAEGHSRPYIGIKGDPTSDIMAGNQCQKEKAFPVHLDVASIDAAAETTIVFIGRMTPMLEVGHWYNKRRKNAEILDFCVNGKEVEGCRPIMQQGTIQLKRRPREGGRQQKRTKTRAHRGVVVGHSEGQHFVEA